MAMLNKQRVNPKKSTIFPMCFCIVDGPTMKGGLPSQVALGTRLTTRSPWENADVIKKNADFVGCVADL